MDTDAVDDWGFTDANHEELQALMRKYAADVERLLPELMQHGRPVPLDDAAGHIGTVAVMSDGQARTFPPGEIFWRLLERLRELDKHRRASRN